MSATLHVPEPGPSGHLFGTHTIHKSQRNKTELKAQAGTHARKQQSAIFLDNKSLTNAQIFPQRHFTSPLPWSPTYGGTTTNASTNFSTYFLLLVSPLGVLTLHANSSKGKIVPRPSNSSETETWCFVPTHFTLCCSCVKLDPRPRPRPRPALFASMPA